MYCGKCGTEVKDGTEICPKCGTRLGADKKPAVRKAVGNAQKHSGVIAAAAVIVLAIVCGVFFLGGNSEQDVIKGFMKGLIEADAKSIVKVVPDKVIEAMMEEDDMDEEEFEWAIEEWDEDLQDDYEKYEEVFGDDWKMTYEVVELQEAENSTLRDVKKIYKKYDIDLDIKAAKMAEVELTVSGSKKEKTGAIYVYLIKVGRSWYLETYNSGFSL